MQLEYQILAAVALDLFLGDPRRFPHPVKLMGKLALALEAPMRRAIVSQRTAGALTAFLVVALTALAAWVLLILAGFLHPYAEDVVAIFLLYTGIAARDMIEHSAGVYEALQSGSLSEARNRVAMICGRDTDTLDESGVARAAVESVAENMVDGVTAPLFFAVLGGPVALMAYKAVSTLDSTFGYKNERYAEFGWLSARLDDVANFIPSRITAVMVPVATAILGGAAAGSVRIFFRDRGRHPSPNAGQAEAAFAGALGVQLGGLSYYLGKASVKPTLGDPLGPVIADHIPRANRLLLVTSGLALVLFLVARILVLEVWIR
ncbi:MAG TPA: adenosylcobinamide-phosphate synthase CbiB [Desulfomonilaceae bacterium]|nr:adenosylcobinamide-phosphate synthase CbiB [Desulfomonilaceae bacterium]